MKQQKAFHRFAGTLLLYTLVVILWGAWVRISHSGDGCGATWPLCNGRVVPEATHAKTWVEFSHRLTSGLFGILVIALVWQGRKIFPPGHRVRKSLYASLFFMITEALLGAKLVLSGLVGQDDSMYRLFVMSLHQLNSLLLTGSVALVVLYSSEGLLNYVPGTPSTAPATTPPASPKPRTPVWVFPLLFAVIVITGGFAALSTTLFPSSSLMDGITQDFSANAHYLLRLRLSHPILATLLGGGLALWFWLRSQHQSSPVLSKASLQVSLALVTGLLFGYLTLFSLAPVWMKLVHLFLAHSMWIVLLRWGALEKLKP
jgi:cytochrome c oxidase assembly protein subunit 15